MTRHVVVIGAGHNGLVAANYLALAGCRVTVLEQRASLGGVVGRFEYFPGYSASITNSPGSFEGTVLEELRLQRYGLRFHRPAVTLLHPFAERLFIGWREQEQVMRQFENFAKGEFERHRSLVARLDELGHATGLSLWRRPSSLEETLSAMPKRWRSDFERLMLHGSLRELLDESLDSDQAKSLMMMLAVNGQLVSPDAPGSAFGLLLRPISRASSGVDPMGNGSAPLRGSVGLPIGSMASIVDALAAAADDNGVNVRLESPVSELKLDDEGRVTGVELECGELVTGIDSVIATPEPSRIAQMLPSDWCPDVERPGRPNGSAFKLALALDALPDVENAPGEVPAEKLLEAQFRIGPSTEYISRAVKDGIGDVPSTEPIIWGLIPSITSPGIAPEGRHLMSLNVWHAPHALGKDYWEENGDAFADRCISIVERSFPGLSSRIVDRRWLGPHHIESEFGLTASNITHGDMLPAEMLADRPNHEFVQSLEASGIFLGGAGTWPGGYVTGIPGRNSAARLLTIEKEFAV